MWTPKRIVLLAVGFLLFSLTYLVYSATSLGRINTLPPLPEQYKQGVDASQVEMPPASTGPTPLEKKLEQAFGIGCPELHQPYLFELNSKSMVMAAGTFEIITDGPVERRGRVKLEPMSLALFGKKKNDGRGVEINTLRCNRAYLTFDRPITGLSPGELNGRKIVEAELFGNIDIVNNRRTIDRTDDLTVAIANGPLYYVENRQLIWTTDKVEVKDGRLEPPKTRILAKSMEMELATATPPPKPGTVPHKPKNESISGVKRITLKQNVRMDLYVNGSTPFPGGKDKSAGKKEQETEGEPPSHVIIETPGSFRYELFKDHDMAYFDVPQDQGQVARSPQDVKVIRLNKSTDGQEKNDQLVCKHLELRVKRRDGEQTGAAATSSKAAASPDQGLEIETVHATGPYVTLTSDAEKLDATGNDFFHDAGQKLSILKGVPYMEAHKDGNLIQTPELRMQDIPLAPARGKAAKTYQHVTAAGPGCIHMPKKTGDKEAYVLHAFWNEQLVSTRDEGLDLLILTGAARFVDDDQGQSLKADTIRVWLLTEENKPTIGVASAPRDTRTRGANPTPLAGTRGANATPLAAGSEQSRRPHHIIALRNIVAHSRELDVPAASRLVIRFKDVPLSELPVSVNRDAKASGDALAPRVPASGVASAPREVAPPNIAPRDVAPREVAPREVAHGALTQPRSPTPRAPTPRGADATPLAPPRGANATPLAAPPAKLAAPSSPPLVLSARSIEADVLRSGERSALHKLWTEGCVRVDQEPAKPNEHGIHIKSETLKMDCFPEGNYLVITDEENMAKLEMDKITIMGAEVNINQATNKAWVHGSGGMMISTDTSMEGKPLGKTVPLNIYWDEDMLFHGIYAEFKGNVNADQDKALLACQSLQVLFDHAISLKEGSKSDRPAKVRSLVAFKDVKTENSEYQGEQLQKFQLIEGKTLTMEATPRDEDGLRPPGKGGDTNDITVTGPGSVRILQRGGADLTAPPARGPAKAPAAQAPGDQVMKLTYVSFGKTMQASNRTNTANFWESVQVISLPCNDPHREIDVDALAAKLPVGALYLRCNHLKVLNEQVRGKSNQQMEAHGQITVRSREFFATADRMYYNEAKDQIIFEADPGNLAYLAKNVVKGAPPQSSSGSKIIYTRSTGNVWGNGMESLKEGN